MNTYRPENQKIDMVNTDDSRYDTLPTKTITDALFGTTNPLALIGD